MAEKRDESGSNPDTDENIDSDSEKVIRELQNKVEDLKQRNIEFESEVEQAINETEENYKVLLEEKEKEILELKQKMNREPSEVSETENEDFVSLKEENKALSEKNKSLDAKLKTKEELISKLESSSDTTELEKQNADLKAKIIEHEGTIKKLQIELNQIETKSTEGSNETEKQLENLQYEVSELNSKIRLMEEEYSQLEKEKVELERKLEDLNKEKAEKASDRLNTLVINKPDLTDLLESEKLVEMIYIRLKELKSVKLKILAMQAGVSEASCKYAIGRLLEAKAINYDGPTKQVSLK